MSKEKRKPSAPTQGPAKHRKSEKPPADTSRGTAAAPDEYLPRPEHTATERAYLDWMRRRGVELHGVTIGRFPRTGRGCVATRDISPGEVLVEVPDDCIITSQTCVAADALRELDDAVAEDPSPRLEREALVLAVMAEMSLGADSAFAPYLAALPTLRATHSPLAWSGAELAELEGTTALARMSLEDEAAELPSMTAAHWKHVARPFLEANPRFARVARADAADAADDDAADDDEIETRKLYLHATALVAGFSFTLGEPDEDDSAEDDSDEDESGGHVSTQAMVPFWDMLNHREPAEASVRLDYDEATSRLRMIAVKPVAAGEEVFNTYGALGDDELLRRYGFVMRRNPHGGGAEVTLREVVEAARLARSQTAPLDVESNPDSDSDSDDYAPPVMPPMSDSEEEEDDDDDAEMDDDEEDDEDDDDASLDGDSRSAGPLSRGEILERLRLLRRWGVASRSSDRFAVSRTGRPSRALRIAARVLSMDREPFREVLAADAYERGEGDDQTGAYSDEDDGDDGDDDGFGGFKPLTVEQVWNGENVLGDDGSDSDSEGGSPEDYFHTPDDREAMASRVQMTLLNLARVASRRFATATAREDRAALRRLGPELPGERERAGLGGWRAAGSRETDRDVGSHHFKPNWRDEQRRAMHRKRMALTVRVREKAALLRLARWASDFANYDAENLLPPLRDAREENADETDKAKKKKTPLDRMTCGVIR